MWEVRNHNFRNIILGTQSPHNKGKHVAPKTTGKIEKPSFSQPKNPMTYLFHVFSHTLMNHIYIYIATPTCQPPTRCHSPLTTSSLVSRCPKHAPKTKTSESSVATASTKRASKSAEEKRTENRGIFFGF